MSDLRGFGGQDDPDDLRAGGGFLDYGALDVPGPPEHRAGGGLADLTLAEVGPSRSLAQDAWRRFRRNRLAIFGLAMIVILAVVAVVGPFLVDDPAKLYSATREPPTNQHWFGTDQLGRDVLARVVYGIRLSILIGLVVAVIATVIGVIVGSVSGWFGGYIDTGLMRFVDIMLGIPYLLLAFAFIALVGKGVSAVVITLGLTAWLQTARTVRAGFLQTKELEYVEAARALGVGRWRIMGRHILPNVFQPVVVLIAVGIGAAVLGEAALSFLGVGIQPPEPSLGSMINESQSFFATSPHLLFFPGLALVMTVLGFLLVGDGLRDAFDVKDLG
jgi:peptide/nickel transport system permease protein